MNNVGMKELLVARKICAQIITKYGEQYLPIFERLESEIDSRNKRQQSLDKAVKIATRNATHFATQNHHHTITDLKKVFNYNNL